MDSKLTVPKINYDATTNSSTPRVRKTKGWGHWNAFLNSKEYTDLTPDTLQISEGELALHNKAGDLWIGLSHEGQVRVYDVTLFAEYHPGGYEILESVAGTDATEDFRVAHAYVNPNMISRFQKGFLYRTKFASPNTLSPGRSMLPPVRKPISKNKPKWNWVEKNNLVTVTFTLHKVLPQGLNTVTIQYKDSNVFKLRIFFETEYYYFEIQLNDTLKVLLDTLKHDNTSNSISIDMSNFSTFQLSHLGGVLDDSMVSVLQAVDKEEYLSCTLLSTRDLNTDCREFLLQWPHWALIGVPLGHHVIVKANINGADVQRPYTPVCKITHSPMMSNSFSCTTLMIKRYHDGVMSSYMHTLDEDAAIFVSLPTGTFKTPSWVDTSPTIKNSAVDSKINSVVFLAAGSGITPMIRLMLSCLFSSDLNCHLTFFNRKQCDIIYADEFAALERLYGDRLKVSNILSQPDQDWRGLTGRISEPMCKELLREDDGTALYLICGPSGFNKSAVGIFRTWQVEDQRIWEFKG